LIDASPRLRGAVACNKMQALRNLSRKRARRDAVVHYGVPKCMTPSS
jgi:hypothetical protein